MSLTHATAPSQHNVTAPVRRKAGKMVYTVLFVSVRNAGRTQMATAWLNALAHPEKVRAMSAGTKPADAVDKSAIDAMKEVGIDLSSSTPRLLTPLVESSPDLIITVAPPLPDPPVHGTGENASWLVADPLGALPERVREIRGEIEKLVRELLVARHWLPYGASAPPSRA